MGRAWNSRGQRESRYRTDSDPQGRGSERGCNDASSRSRGHGRRSGKRDTLSRFQGIFLDHWQRLLGRRRTPPRV